MSEKHYFDRYIERIEKIEDPAAIVVTTHLFCECALNSLMKQKKLTPGEYITDQSAFVVKLDFCFNMGWISKPLFENLLKLNKLRNQCAHKIDIDFDKIDHNYNLVFEKFNVEKEKIIKRKLFNIAMNTFAPLNNELIKLGIKLQHS